jgi:hypothetical protein
MTQPLFIQPDVELEKLGGEVDLPEDPNQWPQEVLQELFKQVPYISDFQPHVTMEKVDSERGYGLGQIEISNKSEAQQGTDPAMLEAAGMRSVRIPVIIQENKLAPFDLLVNDVSKVLPLTENRLRQALFRPQPFDVTSQTPGDQSMIGQLYPPYRQNYGFGGGGVAMNAGMGKQSSVQTDFERMLIDELEQLDGGFRHVEPIVPLRKTASLLQATFSSYNQSDIDEFFTNIESDLGLQAAMSKNAHAFDGPLSLLANYQPVGVEKTASAMAQLVKPTVVQLRRVDDGYLMKTASHVYWRPIEVPLSRRDVVQHFGEKVALAADEAGQVTMTEGADAQEGVLDKEEPLPVHESGLYKVVDEETGNELIGFVIPNLLDTDGTPLPLALFTNGSHSATQPDILGVPAGDGSNMPTGLVNGSGAFFSYTDDGKLQATIPFDLSGGSYTSPGEPATFMGQTFDGRPVEVSIQPNVQTVVQTPEGKVLIPDHWQWTPLGAAEAVSLVSGEPEAEAPEDWHEEAPEAVPEDMESNEPYPEKDEGPAEEKASHVWIRGDHDCFTFTGPGVEKLAADERAMLNLDEAMFLMAALGVDQGYGVVKLGHSMNEPVKVPTKRHIKLASEQDAYARARAAELHAISSQLRRNLVKEAAGIPDPTSVDTVLSLGFINPENIMTFVSYLPTIEDSQAKMCDLLLASRVGVSDIPSTALERAIRSTEEVLEGLKVLAFQGG